MQCITDLENKLYLQWLCNSHVNEEVVSTHVTWLWKQYHFVYKYMCIWILELYFGTLPNISKFVNNIYSICDWILEDLPFGHKQFFWENLNKNIFQINLD